MSMPIAFYIVPAVLVLIVWGCIWGFVRSMRLAPWLRELVLVALIAGQFAIAPLADLTGLRYTLGEGSLHTVLGMLGMTGLALTLLQLLRLAVWLLVSFVGLFAKDIGIGGRRAVEHPLVVVPLFMLALLAGGWGVWSAVRVPDIKQVTISIPTLPKELEGYRIIQLTDLHLGTYMRGRWMRQIVDKVNAEKPDLVVFTGDFGDGAPREIADSLEPLLDVQAKDGIYTCIGNHEPYEGKEQWIDFYEENGMHPLVNAWTAVPRRPIFIAGADIWGRLAGGLDTRAEELKAAMPKDSLKIVLDHLPGRARTNAALGFDLQFSGHTHGGMMFFMQKIVAAANDGFVSGLYDVDGMKLYDSNGTGLWSGMPLRLFVPSEITLVTLTRGK